MVGARRACVTTTKVFGGATLRGAFRVPRGAYSRIEGRE